MRLMTSDGNDSFETRIGSLDGLRGIAVLMILIGHCFCPDPVSWISRILYESMRWLWLGVDLFFVLSGYLITDILIRSRSSATYFKTFYMRRALRILPAYYFVLACIFLGAPLVSGMAADERFQSSWPWFAVYLQNWRIGLGPNIWWDGAHHLWSLAIEEQFYLLWPLVVWAAPLRNLPRICALIFSLILISKLSLWLLGLEWWQTFGLTNVRADGLVAGAWIAAIRALPNAGDWLRPVRYLAWAASLTFAALWFYFMGVLVSGTIVAWVTPVAALVFGAWLFLHLHEAPDSLSSRLLSCPVLSWFGRYSYGLYLIHWPVLRLIRDAGMGQSWFSPWIPVNSNKEVMLLGLIAAVLSTGLAVTMFHFLEQPLLKLKRHFPYTKHSA